MIALPYGVDYQSQIEAYCSSDETLMDAASAMEVMDLKGDIKDTIRRGVATINERF